MRRIQHPLLKCVVIQRVMLKVCGFCANILIYVINAGYLSRAWEAFFFFFKQRWIGEVFVAFPLGQLSQM